MMPSWMGPRLRNRRVQETLLQGPRSHAIHFAQIQDVKSLPKSQGIRPSDTENPCGPTGALCATNLICENDADWNPWGLPGQSSVFGASQVENYQSCGHWVKALLDNLLMLLSAFILAFCAPLLSSSFSRE